MRKVKAKILNSIMTLSNEPKWIYYCFKTIMHTSIWFPLPYSSEIFHSYYFYNLSLGKTLECLYMERNSVNTANYASSSVSLWIDECNSLKIC